MRGVTGEGVLVHRVQPEIRCYPGLLLVNADQWKFPLVAIQHHCVVVLLVFETHKIANVECELRLYCFRRLTKPSV